MTIHHPTLGLVLLMMGALAWGAATHNHAHNHHKERVEDGAFAPRDSHHHSDDGEHNVEFDHEAILGSVKDAEEFDNLSPAEAKKRLAILVRKMDRNGDQFVDRHELKAWILRSFGSLAKEEAAERFEDIDENDDNVVTWSEYLQDTFSIDDAESAGNRDPSEGPHVAEENKLIADDRLTFDAADVNKNGVLDPEEFVAFISPEEFAHMLPGILQQTLRDKDGDGDGKISFQEFIGESGANRDKEWLLAEKDKFDNELDLDGDGSLNGNEILSWVVPSNDEVAADEVAHLFAASDDDHDDRLSYAEILTHSDTFVGSEATDYGDHLQNINHFEDEL